MTVVAHRVKELLDKELICYEMIPHVTDYTALETAEHTHISGKEFAKSVIVLVDQQLIMVVVPAHHRVNLETLRQFLGVEHVKLAKEWRIRRHFADCDTGAIPPFGSLYLMPEYICSSMLDNHCISFNAGSHEMVIKMSFPDYCRLVRPTIVDDLSEPWT